MIDPMPASLREMALLADPIYQFVAIEQAHERGKLKSLERLAGADQVKRIRDAARSLTLHLSDLVERTERPR